MLDAVIDKPISLQRNCTRANTHACTHRDMHSEPTRTGVGEFLLASAPVTVWWERQHVLAPFPLGNVWPGDSHDRCHGAPATPSYPQRGSPRSPHEQSREQCANTGAQCEWTKVVTPGALPLMHPCSPLEQSQMGTCKSSHWPHTWRHLTHHRLVFYSIHVSFLLPLQAPSFQSVNLQLNPWAMIPLPSAPNCVLQILIFHEANFLRVHRRKHITVLAIIVYLEWKKGKDPPFMFL